LLDAEIKARRAVETHRRELRAGLDGVVASMSWRITAPLRALKQILFRSMKRRTRSS
jgi:hypothetical protein